MNPTQAYFKWLQNCYMMPMLFTTAAVNNMTGATDRAKKQKVSAEIYYLNVK